MKVLIACESFNYFATFADYRHLWQDVRKDIVTFPENG